MINNKIVLLIIISVLIILSNPLFVKAQNHAFGETETLFKLEKWLIEIYLQTHQIFQNQTFWTKAIITTNQSYGADTFNATIELPPGLTLLNGSYQYSNPPINETTNFQWTTTWFINSSDATPNTYTINVTENLFYTKASDDVTVNLGPTLPYNVTVETDKASYSPGDTGFVNVYISDNNNYPFNLDGNCSSTIYYPDGSLTSFSGVFMVYEVGGMGKYINNFLVWDTLGTYTVEVNCTNPEDGYASNTFEVSGVTTAPATTAPPGRGPSGPGPARPPKIANFTLDKDLIKVELKPGKTGEKVIRVSNTGETKLTITGRIQYLDEFLFFTETGTEITFELNPDETEKLEVNFIAKEDQEPGIYPGEIVFTADIIERTVLVVVEVESEKPLFDVKVEILPEYRVVYPGNKVMAQLTLYNLGKIGVVDTDVEYGIKSLNGTVITSEHEMMAFETQLSTVKSIDLPSGIKPDSYVFYSKVTYEGIVGTGSSMFEVIEEKKLWLYLILFLLLLIIMITLIKYFGKLGKFYEKRRFGQF